MCVPVTDPCYYGMDFPSREELFANNHADVEAMEKWLQVAPLPITRTTQREALNPKPESLCLGPLSVDARRSRPEFIVAHCCSPSNSPSMTLETSLD